MARFEGIDDRGAAEALRGSLVEIDRSALPALEEGEYYHADLIGLPAVDREGSAVGTVVAVENYGAGDLLEIELEGGKRSLIPFRRRNRGPDRRANRRSTRNSSPSRQLSACAFSWLAPRGSLRAGRCGWSSRRLRLRPSHG